MSTRLQRIIVKNGRRRHQDYRMASIVLGHSTRCKLDCVRDRRPHTLTRFVNGVKFEWWHPGELGNITDPALRCSAYNGLSKRRSRRETSSSALRAASDVTIGPTFSGGISKEHVSLIGCKFTLIRVSTKDELRCRGGARIA